MELKNDNMMQDLSVDICSKSTGNMSEKTSKVDKSDVQAASTSDRQQQQPQTKSKSQNVDEEADSVGDEVISAKANASRRGSRRLSSLSNISEAGAKVGRRLSQAIAEVDWKEINSEMQRTF